MSYKFVEGYRPNDWTCYCAICGSKTWASDIQTMGEYTGREGLKCCPDCIDPIDYGLVPYRIPVEQSVPFVNYLLPTPVDNSFDMIYETMDPMNIGSQNLGIWANCNKQVWANWNYATWSKLINV